jgi:hypothetical protein
MRTFIGLSFTWLPNRVRPDQVLVPFVPTDSNQMSITKLFNKATSQTSKGFIIVYFKRLLLDFIVNNNISFKAITTLSFKKLL